MNKKIIYYLFEGGKNLNPSLKSLGKPRDAKWWSLERIFSVSPRTHDIFLYTIECKATLTH